MITFKKLKHSKPEMRTVYFNSKNGTITNKNQINELIQLSIQQILKKIGQWLSEGSGWTIESVYHHYLNIVKYKPMSGKSYIQLPKELRHHMKGLINLQNKDNECFRWCHIRHLNPQNKDPQRVKKIDREYVKVLL